MTWNTSKYKQNIFGKYHAIVKDCVRYQDREGVFHSDKTSFLFWKKLRKEGKKWDRYHRFMSDMTKKLL